MKDSIRREIRAFVAERSASSQVATAWDEPVVGFVAADDPGFAEVRQLLGPSHAMPHDLMPSARSVVALFAPYARQLARDNRPGRRPARSWCVAFTETREMLDALGEHLRGWLAGRGHDLVSVPESHAFDAGRLAADWSHKHAAVLAGLGRPGHHSMLITERGCFGRVWTFLTDVPLASDPRVTHEPCLRRAERECSHCIDRCVGDALFEDHFDRQACWARCLSNEGRFPELPANDVCGKCMVGVPCSHLDPVLRSGEKEG
jgi:epoxyqueuosine reductase QueG